MSFSVLHKKPAAICSRLFAQYVDLQLLMLLQVQRISKLLCDFEEGKTVRTA